MTGVAVSPQSPPLVLGRYELLGQIARGGMGEVHLARATGMGGFERLFVVKRMTPELAVRATATAMFIDEARIVAALHHPNIVSVIELGHDASGVYMVLEYLDGRDVRTILSRCARTEPLPLPIALHIAMSMCAGLHHAHEQTDKDGRPLGIVHRDVSPHNVIVTFTGETKLIDFGIARSADRLGHTATNMVKGKAGYMAPEQCRALPVDRRADVFCAGIVLFELTTGHRLFRGNDQLETMQLIADRPPTRPSAVSAEYPPELERIILRALERSPEDRYPTALALYEDLDRFAKHAGLRATTMDLCRYLRATFADGVARRDAARSRSIEAVVADAADRGEPTPATAIDTAPTVTLGPPRRAPQPPPQPSPPSPTWRPLLAGAVAVVVIGAGVWFATWRSPAAVARPPIVDARALAPQDAHALDAATLDADTIDASAGADAGRGATDAAPRRARDAGSRAHGDAPALIDDAPAPIDAPPPRAIDAGPPAPDPDGTI